MCYYNISEPWLDFFGLFLFNQKHIVYIKYSVSVILNILVWTAAGLVIDSCSDNLMNCNFVREYAVEYQRWVDFKCFNYISIFHLIPAHKFIVKGHV